MTTASNGFMVKCAAAIALLWAGGISRAEGILHRHYRMKKLMPCGMITAIEPAGRYVWFGGWELRPGEEHGLARYDKRTRKWELFLESEGVIADEINAIAADGEKLWIGSGSDWRWNRGLHLYDPKKQTSRRFTQKDGLPHWRVRGIAVLDDDVWIATMGGVGRYHKKTGTWTPFTKKGGHLAGDFTTCVYADDAHVWVGTYGGLEMYDTRTGRWRSLNKQNSLFRSAVIDIAGGEEKVWFLTQHRVITYDRTSREFSRPPILAATVRESTLRNIEVTQDKVFLGSERGLHVWDEQAETWQTYDSRNGLLYDCVYTLAADEDCVWCVDKLGRVASQLRRRAGRWSHFHYREGSPSNHIKSLVSDGSSLYVGTLGNGLWEYDVRRNRWTNLNLLLKSRQRSYNYRGEKTPIKFSHITQMAIREGRVWMATNHGLCLHDPAAPEDIEALSPESYPMLCLAWSGGKWYCGGQRDGLRTFDPRTRTWADLGKKIGLEKKVAAIQAGANALWVSDGKNVFRFASGTEKLTRINAPPKGGIKALLLHDGKLWIGTDHGLWTYDTEKNSAREIDRAKLPSPVVLTLAYARGRICIGTHAGLASCTPDGGDWRTWTKDDLLVDNVVGAVAGDAQYLWVGTMGGGFTRLTGVNPPDTEENAE